MKKSEVSKKEIIKLIKKDGYNLTKYKKYFDIYKMGKLIKFGIR